MYCPSCGTQMPEGGQVCPGCGLREAILPAVMENDPAMRMLLPIGCSGYAIIAGYFGLFSLIIFPAPLALIFGLLALRDIKQHPHKGGRGRAIFGVVMGAIFKTVTTGTRVATVATVSFRFPDRPIPLSIAFSLACCRFVAQV